MKVQDRSVEYDLTLNNNHYHFFGAGGVTVKVNS